MFMKDKKYENKNKPINNQINEAVKAEKQYIKDYYAHEFDNCHREGKDLGKIIFETIYNNAMLAAQDFPSAETRTAIICFYSFACNMFTGSIKELFDKKVEKVDLPVILPALKRSQFIIDILADIKKNCTKEGFTLAKRILDNDYALFFALCKTFNYPTALNNLLISHFRVYTWLLIDHLKNSERKHGK